MLFTQSFEKGFVYCKKIQNNVQSLMCEVCDFAQLTQLAQLKCIKKTIKN